MPDNQIEEIENGERLMLDFDKLAKVAACGQPLVPVAVQDAETKQVLILAYANQLALEHTLKTGLATFWSTSRNELWEKGATSGDALAIVEVRVNCDQNSLLYLVRPRGAGACHTSRTDGSARSTCYYRRLEDGRLSLLDSER